MGVSKEILMERGRAANERNRYEEAVKHYDGVLALDAASGEAWQGKATALESMGNYADAITSYTRAAECDPSRFRESASYGIGNCQAHLGDRAGAIQSYDEVVRLNPESSSAWHNRGMALFELGRDEDAATSFARAANVSGSPARSVTSWVWNAHCLARVDRTAEADESIRQANESGDTTATWTAWLQVANHELMRNNPARVVGAADRALVVDENVAPAWIFRGIGLARLARTEEALKAFDRATTFKETALSGWANQATLLEGIGRHRAAVAASERVAALEPQSVEDHIALVRALQVLGRPEEALRSIAVVKKKMPGLASIWQEEGLAMEALGRTEEAIASYRQFLTYAPESPTALLRLAKCLFQMGRADESATCADRAIKLVPDSAQAWLHKGASLGQLGRMEEAVQCLTRALQSNPRESEARVLRGMFELQLGRAEKALADFDEVLEVEPNEVNTIHAKARALQSLGRNEQAQSWATTAEGISLLAGGHVAEAEAKLVPAAEADPSNWAAPRALASIYQQAGYFRNAVEEFQRALALRPQDAQLWSDCGVTWSQLDDKLEAARCFREALQVNPTFGPALRNAAICASERKDFPEALALYDRTLELDNENGNAWYGRGVALTKLDRINEAVESFERCVAINPMDMEAWKDLGTCLAHQQRFKPAIAAWKRVLELDPQADVGDSLRQLQASGASEQDRVEILGWQGNTALAKGNYPEAAAWFDQALALEPRNATILNDRGLCAEVLENPNLAIEYFDRSLAVEPENAHAWYNKGVSLQRLRQHSEAIAAFEQVVALHPADAPIDDNLMHSLHNLGGSQLQLGRKEEALDSFDAVLKYARENPERWREEAKRALDLKRLLHSAGQ